jgi:hypothetical protein
MKARQVRSNTKSMLICSFDQKGRWNTFSGAFEKLRKTIISFPACVCPSVCVHRTLRIPLDGF